MAKYTIELRKVCDIYKREEVEKWFKSYELTDFLTPEQIEIIANANIWNKDKLAKKIVDHYFMREIGFETPALFSHYAKVTMQELMEEKLPLIYSSSIKYDPLINVNYTETFERIQEGTLQNNGERNQKGSSKNNIERNQEGSSTNNGESNSNSNSNSESLNINNSTPQTRINKQDLETGIYANNVTQSDNNSIIDDKTTTKNITSINDKITTLNDTSLNDKTITKNNESSSTNENYIKIIKGNSGVSATSQKMIEQYRQNIIAIDRDIIQELNILFMGLY